jgi:hypothetical protein
LSLSTSVSLTISVSLTEPFGIIATSCANTFSNAVGNIPVATGIIKAYTRIDEIAIVK